MKNKIICIVAGLALAFSAVACTGFNPKVAEQLAVQYAVVRVVQKNPAKAAVIIAVAEQVKNVAGGQGFDTVDALIAFVQSKINLAGMDPADQMFVPLLIEEVRSALKAEVGSGVIPVDKLLVVGEVAGWVEDAAKMAVPPAATPLGK